MPNLNEILKSLAELNPEPKEFATELQSVFQPGFHEVFERGHKTKASSAKKDIADLTAKLEAKDTEIADLTTKLETAGKGTVDVEKVRADYKKEIADLKTKQATELKTKDDKFSSALVDSAVKSAQAFYEAAGLFPIHAKAQAGELRDRIRPNLETGSFDVLKEAGSDVAIQPADGKSETALKALVEETRKPLPKEMYASGKVGKGSEGVEGGATGGDANVYDRIRSRRKAEAEGQGADGKGKAGALMERMGVARPA